ncbi:MAG TPA: hypothetical protein VKA06_02875, partial [Spirochaetia bacterium]|nr:hypothetical protein [Spirochaetia bacterium]
MILPTGRLQIGHSDPNVNAELRTTPETSGAYSSHFSQNEEYFIRLPEPIEVPAFPVHHELGKRAPHPDLAEAVRSVTAQVHRNNGDILGGLTHLFDPSSSARPAYFRLYRMQEITYLYLVRIDLTYRPRRSVLVERTTSARTAHHRTNDIFIESDLFPILEVETEDNKIRSMALEQSISDTWIGETGRGYMRAGMWLDRDLTKFFSRLFTPPSVQTYPYFPFTCKYRTIAHSVLGLRENDRRRGVQLLNRARAILLPALREIE